MIKKVDILLTYWGDFSLLKKTFDSVLAQTSDDWRLFIIDDHYPSLDAKKFFEKITDNRVTYIRHKKNIGITRNFNFAIDQAQSKYCMLLGCDDIMLPNYIEIALKNIGDADFYQPSVEIIDENDVVYKPLGDRVKSFLQPNKSGLYAGEKLATSLCNGNWLYFPSILWKTETIKTYRFDERYKILEDVILELNILKDGGILQFDTTKTFQYRRFASSQSSIEKKKGGVRFTEENDVYTQFSAVFYKLGWKRAARAAKLRITSRVHSFIS
jgi:glycosyltransferase involved in cell wall biosynthesis